LLLELLPLLRLLELLPLLRLLELLPLLRLLELLPLLRLLELLPLLRLVGLLPLLRLLELLPLLRLLELLLPRLLELLLLSPPPPRRPCANTVEAAIAEGSNEVASTSVPSRLIMERVFMPPPCAPSNQALAKQKGCRFVGQYTPPYLKGTLRKSRLMATQADSLRTKKRERPDAALFYSVQ
jgi:hypothetical protein